MDIDCIADLHGHFPKLQGGDLLIVAGDLTTGDPAELVSFSEWIVRQDYQKIVVIAGNHDPFMIGLEQDCFTEPHISYLCDAETEFGGYKIWGSPFSILVEGLGPEAAAFMLPEKKLAKKWSLIPADVDILVTHGPPYGILDKNRQGILCGSTHLREAINRKAPKVHVFGHIHEAYGEVLHHDSGPHTRCINASLRDENFDPVNSPVRIKL